MPTSWTRETTLGTSTSSMSVTTLTTTGNVTVGGTLTSTGTITGTLVTAAQGNITSVGTLTTLTVDNVIVNGTTIGHTSDTDLMTLASGALTVSGTITVGVDDTGHDVKFFGATASNYMIYDQSDDMLKIYTTGSSSGSGSVKLIHTDTDALAGPKLIMRRIANDALNDVIGNVTFSADDDGDGETAYAAVRGQVGASAGAMAAGAEEGALNLIAMANGTETSGILIKGQADGTADVNIANGAASITTVAGDLAITGGNITTATTFDSTVTVGVDDAGHDVKFFGNTASHYMLWDTSEDTLRIASTGNTANLILSSSDTDAATGPGITLERIATGADNDALGKIDFYGRDDGGNTTLYARLYSQLITAADGGEVGSMQFQMMTESASGNTVKTGLWIKGSSTNDRVTCNMPNGGLIIGLNSSSQGSLTLWDGAGGNTPGYIVLYSPNGTANYIFCEDDGTLKRHTSIPTANGDGSEIGGQS